VKRASYEAPHYAFFSSLPSLGMFYIQIFSSAPCLLFSLGIYVKSKAKATDNHLLLFLHTVHAFTERSEEEIIYLGPIHHLSFLLTLS